VAKKRGRMRSGLQCRPHSARIDGGRTTSWSEEPKELKAMEMHVVEELEGGPTGGNNHLLGGGGRLVPCRSQEFGSKKKEKETKQVFKEAARGGLGSKIQHRATGK